MEAKRELRNRRLEAARKTLEDQERMQNRREEREKRRREIALEVAGDLGEEEEQRLKKMYVAKQLYSNLLSSRLERNESKSSALQQGVAFLYESWRQFTLTVVQVSRPSSRHQGLQM